MNSHNQLTLQQLFWTITPTNTPLTHTDPYKNKTTYNIYIWLLESEIYKLIHRTGIKAESNFKV